MNDGGYPMMMLMMMDMRNDHRWAGIAGYLRVDDFDVVDVLV
jgi:hypothetical protein